MVYSIHQPSLTAILLVSISPVEEFSINTEKVVVACGHPTEPRREVKKEALEQWLKENPSVLFAGECESRISCNIEHPFEGWLLYKGITFVTVQAVTI
jgi:hypothetical protein